MSVAFFTYDLIGGPLDGGTILHIRQLPLLVFVGPAEEGDTFAPYGPMRSVRTPWAYRFDGIAYAHSPHESLRRK